MWRLALLSAVERSSILLKLLLAKLEKSKFRLNMIRHFTNGCTILFTSLDATMAIETMQLLSPVFAATTYLVQQYISAKKLPDKIADVSRQIVEYDQLREKIYISKNDNDFDTLHTAYNEISRRDPIFDLDILDAFYKECKAKGIEVTGESFQSLSMVTTMRNKLANCSDEEKAKFSAVPLGSLIIDINSPASPIQSQLMNLNADTNIQPQPQLRSPRKSTVEQSLKTLKKMKYLTI